MGIKDYSYGLGHIWGSASSCPLVIGNKSLLIRKDSEGHLKHFPRNMIIWWFTVYWLIWGQQKVLVNLGLSLASHIFLRPFQPQMRKCTTLCYMEHLVGGLEDFLFSHILGIIIPIDFHVFQRGGPTTNQIMKGGWEITVWNLQQKNYFPKNRIVQRNHVTTKDALTLPRWQDASRRLITNVSPTFTEIVTTIHDCVELFLHWLVLIPSGVQIMTMIIYNTHATENHHCQ